MSAKFSEKQKQLGKINSLKSQPNKASDIMPQSTIYQKRIVINKHQNKNDMPSEHKAR